MAIQHDYNAEERAREKEISREEDAKALAAGEKSREELRRENSRFVGGKILFDKARHF